MCQQLLWTGPIHPGKEDTHIPSLSCGILEERYSSFSLHMWRIKYNQADRIELQRGPSGMSLFSHFVCWSCICDTEVLKAVGPERSYRSLPNFRGMIHSFDFMLSNILNSKIAATQQSVLMPPRGQKSILSFISSSPSHQQLNGCVVNPWGVRGVRKNNKTKQKKRFFCAHFPFSPYCKRRIKESQPILSPTGPASAIQSNTTVGILSPRAVPPHSLSAVSTFLPLQILIWIILLRKKK